MIIVRNFRFLAAGVLAAGLVLAPLANSPAAGCAVTTAATAISGLAPHDRHAVDNAVDLIRSGDYSLAYLGLGAASHATSLPAKSRLLSAFTLLVAGDTLGAFPPRSCPS